MPASGSFEIVAGICRPQASAIALIVSYPCDERSQREASPTKHSSPQQPPVDRTNAARESGADTSLRGS